MKYKEYIPKIGLEKYDYELPKERIAEFPLKKREESKMLRAELRTGEITHHIFKDITELLPENSLLVINETKVISARLKVKKETGGKAEIFCVDPVFPSNDPQFTMLAKKSCRWKCIIGGRKILSGTKLWPENNDSGIELSAVIIEKEANEAIVEFTWKPENLSFSEVLEKTGKTPLPPYIKREALEEDKNDYQTVYASNDGSVAAPTAGLHFTDSILKELKQKGTDTCRVTLHVGPGTFKPIEAGDISAHDMHSEMIILEKKSLEQIVAYLETAENPNIVTTGTTSLRTLESFFWLGAEIYLGHGINKEHFKIEQWQPYLMENTERLPSRLESMQALLKYMNENNMDSISGNTQLFCVPGYCFKMADSLITNYHMPKSTLILLVAAFIGMNYGKKRIKRLWRMITGFLAMVTAHYL